MNFSAINDRLTFRQVVWLFPFAFTLHVVEEICCFTVWARRFASPEFSFDDYLKIYVLGIVISKSGAMFLRFGNSKDEN